MFTSLAKSFAREKSAVALLLLLGAAARLVWASIKPHLTPGISESHNVAASMAQSGRFADTFFPNQGFTAHVGMLTPLPGAMAYWLFGVDTPVAEFVLSIWATALVCLSFWLCWRLLCVLNAPPVARVAAIAFASLMPLQFGLEVRDLRTWEAPLAVTLLLWVLLRLLAADQKKCIGARDLVITGTIAGFLFIVSPPAGLAAVISIGLFQLLRLRRPQWWIAPVAFAIAAGSLAGFWAERNLSRLGEAIPLRDNLGLEFAVANYSGAVHPADLRAAFVARLHAIHPLYVGTATAAMQAAGGEVPYYHELGKEAGKWIVTHPSDFVYLSLRRFVQFYLPPRWFWSIYGAPGKIVWLRQFLIWATVIAGFGTLITMAYRRRAYAYILTTTLACSLPYIFVQPILRYRYLVSSLLIFLAFDGVGRLAEYALKIRREANFADPSKNG